MAIPKFFHFIDCFKVDNIIELDQSEARHAIQARRLNIGDEVMLLNGKGLKAKGKLEYIDKRNAHVKIESVANVPECALDVVVACATPKGDRQKILIDMLTQLGISGFIPLDCEFSVTKATSKNVDKWQKVIVEACKQSENAHFPMIYPPLSFVDLIESEYFLNREIFRAEQKAKSDDVIFALKKKRPLPKFLILVGPEGGFSPKEDSILMQKGVHLINIGDHILRTETAAIAAVSKFM